MTIVYTQWNGWVYYDSFVTKYHMVTTDVAIKIALKAMRNLPC